MRSQSTWLIVLVALCSLHLIQATVSNTLTDKDHEKKVKSTPKLALADDPRFNKMLPTVTNALKEDGKNSTEDDYYEEYYSDYDDDLKTNNNKLLPTESKHSKSSAAEATTAAPPAVPIGKLKPIKGDDKGIPKDDAEQALDELADDEEDYDEDDDDDDDDYDDDDIIADKDDIPFNEKVPCPRDCICKRNINSYLVATCSRLDADVQKFRSEISDLVVVDVGPKYPILLGPSFFTKVGLKKVQSIRIVNCTIEHLDVNAFSGLDALYSVNLTNVGLTSINPNTFVSNHKLRMLTISGNDLISMTHEKYLLKSTNIEEIDLSRNNLKQLKPTAFDQLRIVYYINLAHNGLVDLPAGLFDNVETIEELNLSHNLLTTLPHNIFNRTALTILHLHNNDIGEDLKFGNSDLQVLDLSYNSIKKIHHGMFDKMEGLTNLNLKGNGIQKIAPDSFLALRKLRHIDLSTNSFDQISGLIFFKNTELNVIRMGDNAQLTELPPDGFVSSTGDFTVYLFDLNSCAISSLGENTFASMPYLVTLRLAWNNIANLDKNTFIHLKKLTELDLSNNLINRLDNSTFVNNEGITKLNLAGNTIRKLSVDLFAPFEKLKELDISECELSSLLVDNNGDKKYKFFDTLRYLNVSFNQIKTLAKTDVEGFKNLKTIDFTNNPIKCNDDFKKLIKFLTKNNVYSKRSDHNSEIAKEYDIDTHSIMKWETVAKNICKHTMEANQPKEKTIEEIRKDILKESDIDITKFVFQQTEKNAKKKDASAKTENDEYDEGDDENYSEYEDDEDLDDVIKTKHSPSEVVVQPHVKDLGIKVNEIPDLDKEIDGDIVLHDKLTPKEKPIKKDDDEDDSGEDYSEEDDGEYNDEIIVERGHIYYNGYRFLLPLVVILSAVIVLLFALSKMITLMMRKRGERYKLAILASKNSIVYQKLSEELPKKQPKKHIYAPIEQV
ncbi:Gp150 family protein [Megaselia abdita]